MWFKGTWLQRSEPSNHSHSLSVYQTTHGWLWLLKKTTSLQNHTSQFRFEFETFQLSGEKSSNSLFFSFCRRLNKNNVNEVSGSFSLTHLCVWLWGGGWSVPDESMNNTQAELADRKMYTLSFYMLNRFWSSLCSPLVCICSSEKLPRVSNVICSRLKQIPNPPLSFFFKGNVGAEVDWFMLITSRLQEKVYCLHTEVR